MSKAQTKADWPTLRIRVPDAIAILSTVELDGKMLPATRVQFDTGDVRNGGGMVSVTVTFYANLDVEVTGEASVSSLELLKGDDNG